MRLRPVHLGNVGSGQSLPNSSLTCRHDQRAFPAFSRRSQLLGKGRHVVPPGNSLAMSAPIAVQGRSNALFDTTSPRRALVLRRSVGTALGIVLVLAGTMAATAACSSIVPSQTSYN